MNKHLFSRRQQLSLRSDDGGKLFFCYLGPRLSCPDDAFLAPPAEAPFYATDYDARGRWGNASQECALQLRLPNGSLALDLRLLSLTEAEDETAAQLELLLGDALWPDFRLRLRLRAWKETDVWELQPTLHWQGQGELELLQADSLALPFAAARYFLSSFRGAWGGESLLHEEELQRGNRLVLDASCGIKNAQEGMPAFVLALDSPAREEEGRCLLGALAWSGNYRLDFKHSAYGHLYLRMGHDFSQSPYRMSTGQELELPAALLLYSEAGKGDASRRLHRHLRRHLLPHGEETRRSLLNSWEGAHFDVHENRLREMMSATAQLGLEMFVLDDGWFGQRKNDHSSLGDWQEDPDKLPHGLGGLCRVAEKEGIAFGLWMEPEMICPQSELYRAHPDWALQLPSRRPREERHQLVLDLCKPQVQAFIEESVARILHKNPGITYIKWDCNRKFSELGSPSLPAEKQSNLPFDYIRAYYGIMQRLRRRFPDVCFQCCSAGGGRLDLGAAAYHEEFWCSDNTDALERLRMQWSMSHIFPANALGSHVTVSPNLYSRRSSSLKFRFDVAMACRIGIELDPCGLSEGEAEEIRERLALAKRLRPLVQLGDLYRLLSPYEGADSALLFRHGGQLLLLAYSSERLFTDQNLRLHLPRCAVEISSRYHIEEMGTDETGYHCGLQAQRLGGDSLLATGIPLRWNRPLQSCVLLLTPES